MEPFRIDRHKIRMASELLKLGLIHALDYGVANADLNYRIVGQEPFLLSV